MRELKVLQAEQDDSFDEYEGELMPPDEFLDEYHPNNDRYIKSVRAIQRQITAASAQMRNKHVMIVRAAVNGKRGTEIAKDLYCTPATVYKVLNSDAGKRLKALIRHHIVAIEGPNMAQRRSLLWRIAADNEHALPKVAISAVGELNAMHHQAHQRENPANQPASQPNQVTILIDARISAPSPLDQ